MDNNSTKKKVGSSSSSSWCWTNERHVHFLNSIEASFVRAMFENNGNPPLRRLDRHLPDSFESTRDLVVKERRRRYSTSDVADPSLRSQRKKKRSMSNDQVVPQLENRRDDKDEKYPR